MTNEKIPHNILENKNETNVEHPYQGKFRRSLLDVSLLEYAINKDKGIRQAGDFEKRLVVTCLDHIVNDYRFTYRGEIICCTGENDFLRKLATTLDMHDVYVSRSEDSKNLKKWGWEND